MYVENLAKNYEAVQELFTQNRLESNPQIIIMRKAVFKKVFDST